MGDGGQGTAASAAARGHQPPVQAPTAVVALDGPAGSGKSTVARRVAEELGWRFVDTGATYRAVTLAVLRQGIDPADREAVAEVVRAADVTLGTGPGQAAVQLDGEDVSAEIRGPAVTAAVSAVSAIPAVRQVLVDLQRRAIGAGRAVVEGRDIATVVAPQAAVKVYLDARPEVRARRRAGDVHVGVTLPAGGQDDVQADEQRASRTADVPTERHVLRSLQRRDALDSQTNELAVSQGAVHLDTSDLTLDEVVGVIVGWVRASQAGEPRP